MISLKNTLRTLSVSLLATLLLVGAAATPASAATWRESTNRFFSTSYSYARGYRQGYQVGFRDGQVAVGTASLCGAVDRHSDR